MVFRAGTVRSSLACREHTATHVIATEETGLVPEVMRLTGGKGARIALDSKADTLPQGGHVSLGQERSDKMPHAM